MENKILALNLEKAKELFISAAEKVAERRDQMDKKLAHLKSTQTELMRLFLTGQVDESALDEIALKQQQLLAVTSQEDFSMTLAELEHAESSARQALRQWEQHQTIAGNRLKFIRHFNQLLQSRTGFNLQEYEDIRAEAFDAGVIDSANWTKFGDYRAEFTATSNGEKTYGEFIHLDLIDEVNAAF